MEKVVAALAKARPNFPRIAKDKTAKVKAKSGAEYQYKYSGLEDVLDAVAEPLSKQELVLNHITSLDPLSGEDCVWACLWHSSGQVLASRWALNAGNGTHQEAGSALTYGRRYAACAVLGIAPQEDDDGATAPARGRATSKSSPKPTPVKQEPFNPSEIAKAMVATLANAGSPDELKAVAEQMKDSADYTSLSPQDVTWLRTQTFELLAKLRSAVPS